MYFFLFFTKVYWKSYNLGPTEYPQEKILDTRNTHEKKFETHEIPTRKKLGHTIYPREKIWDLRNTHKKNFRTHEDTMARWYETHETHNGRRPTEFSTRANNELKKTICNFQSMKSKELELNRLFLTFFCFITWLDEASH